MDNLRDIKPETQQQHECTVRMQHPTLTRDESVHSSLQRQALLWIHEEVCCRAWV